MAEKRYTMEELDSNHSAEKFLVWKRLKHFHKKEMTEDELNTIEEIYFNKQKESIVNLAYYRLINTFLGVFCLLALIISEWMGVTKYFYAGLTLFFISVNTFYGLNAKMRLKRLKEKQKRIEKFDGMV